MSDKDQNELEKDAVYKRHLASKNGSSGFRVGRRQPVGKNPLSLASHDSRSVLAVKGSLRRAKRAPLTAPGRSRGRNLYEGKGITGRYPRF